MLTKATRVQVFVYCDDPSHAPKREPIAVFTKIPSGGWHEQAPKHRQGRAGHVGTGMHMVGDAPALPGWANDPTVSNADLRSRYELVCERTPACRRRPTPARQEHLFDVLDKWQSTGAPEIALSVLAANLEERTKRDAGPSRGNG